MVSVLPISIMFVAIYISIRQSQENDTGTVKLLRLHFVNLRLWYFANYLTNLLIGILLTCIMILIVLLLSPECFIGTAHNALNILFFICSGIFSVSYAMILSLVIKKPRYTIIISFILAMFIAFFNIFLARSDQATYFIGFFLPNYSMQYYYFRVLNQEYISMGFLFYGLIMSITQIIGGYIIVELPQII